MTEVRLVDLEIIKRYSLAVRQEAAPAEELLAALDASRDVVAAALNGSSSRKGRRARAAAGATAAATTGATTTGAIAGTSVVEEERLDAEADFFDVDDVEESHTEEEAEDLW